MNLKKYLAGAGIGVLAIAGYLGFAPDNLSPIEVLQIEAQAQELFGGNANDMKKRIFNEMRPSQVKMKGKDWELTGMHFKSLLKENAEDGWIYEENGKTLGFESTGMAWDGVKVKTKAAKVVGEIEELTVKYNDALGAGIDIKIVQDNYHFQKIVEIESLASLGEIPVDTEFLEFSFLMSGDFDLPQGLISDRIPFGENSFLHPVRAWDKGEDNPSGAFGEITGGVLTKKIPVAWLLTAEFPVSTDVTITFGSEAVFNSANSFWINSDFDSANGKVVIAYTDASDSNNGYAVVGTVSGTSISFGTPVELAGGGTIDKFAVAFDVASGKVAIAYQDGADLNHGRVIIGTVSGTAISYGTAVEFNAAESTPKSMTYDSTNEKVVLFYQDGSDNFGYGIVGTVSGTSISFGTAVLFSDDDAASDVSSAYDVASGKTVVFYQGESGSGDSKVGTVSGTAISFGTIAEFNNASTSLIKATYDATNAKVVVAFADNGNSEHGYAAVGTVSGTTISFGSTTNYSNSNVVAANAVTYDSNAQKVVIAYRDGGDTFGYASTGTVTGTGISFETPDPFTAAATDFISATYDSTNKKIVIAYRDVGNSNFGTGIVGSVPSAAVATGNFFLLF